MQNLSGGGGGTCNWPLKGGARLIEVAATAGGTVVYWCNAKMTISTDISPRVLSSKWARILEIICGFTSNIIRQGTSFLINEDL